MQKRLNLLLICCCLLSTHFVTGSDTANSRQGMEAPPPCTLPAPTNLQKTFTQPSTVVYTWNPVGGAVKYHAILTNLTLGGIQVSQQAIGTTITFSGLIPGHSYQFSVAAMCADKDVSIYAAYDYFTAPNIIIDLIVELQSGCTNYGAPIGSYASNNAGVYTCSYNWQTGHEYWMKITNSDVVLRFSKNANLPNRYDMTVVDPSGGEEYTLTCGNSSCYEVLLYRNGSYYLSVFFPGHNGITSISPTQFPIPFIVYDGCSLGFDGGDDRADEAEDTSNNPNLELQVTAVNPFSDQITLYFGTPPDGSVKTRLLDLQGRSWVETVIQPNELTEGAYSIPTVDLPAGMYFLQVETLQGQVVTRKVMKL